MAVALWNERQADEPGVTTTGRAATFDGSAEWATERVRALTVLLADKFGTRGHPYKSMAAVARKVAAAVQDTAPAVVPGDGYHDKAIRHGAGYVCDCGHVCADQAALDAHTVATYNQPDETAVRLRGASVHTWHEVRADAAAGVTTCARAGCANAGNAVGCYVLSPSDGPRLFGLPSEAYAWQFADLGGLVSDTYRCAWC